MKNVENVSLAGSVFALEVDARAAVQTYLQKAEANLSDMSPADKAELLKDFEASIAAHLHEQGFGKDKAASKEIVDAILLKMGDLGDETAPKVAATNDRWNFLRQPFALSKTNKVVFGLCGAIAERLAVDAIWVRLAFVLLALLTHGGVVFVYFVVSIILSFGEGYSTPSAKTLLAASERARSNVNLSGWRGVLGTTAQVVQKVIRYIFAGVTGALFVLSLLVAQAAFLAMVRRPAFDLWPLGYNRSLMAYVFVGSAILGLLLFTGALFKQVVFPSKKPAGPMGIISLIILVTLVSGSFLTSAFYLRNDMLDWSKRHPDNAYFRLTQDEQGSIHDACISGSGDCLNRPPEFQ